MVDADLVLCKKSLKTHNRIKQIKKSTIFQDFSVYDCNCNPTIEMFWYGYKSNPVAGFMLAGGDYQALSLHPTVQAGY